jgi:hypothetical protein
MMRWLFAGLASVGLIATGLVHGFWTERWRPAPATAAAAARLDEVPLAVGDWQGQIVEVKPGQAGAGVAGFIQRRYVNRKTGATVVMALICGRPGPVCIHTPEACYGATGYTVGGRKKVEVAKPAGARFWTADATKSNATDETWVRIYWGWNGGRGWAAPEDSRLTFDRRYDVLHKLYVIRELGGGSASPKSEPCEEFLNALLPELDRGLFAAGS